MGLNTTGINEIYWRMLWECSKDNDLEKIKVLLDSISPLQMKCKKWLVSELTNLPFPEKISIQLFGGWFGYPLTDMLNENFNINLLENIDIDEYAIKLSKVYNSQNNLANLIFRSRAADVSVPWKTDTIIDLVINTSSEHMPDLPVLIKDKKYKPGCIFALQSNNMFHLEEHINCVNSKEELEHKSGLSRILYSGTLEMPNGYERYMVIGLQ